MTRRRRRDEARWYHGSCGTLSLKDVPRAHRSTFCCKCCRRPTTAASAPLAQALNLGIGRAAYEAALEYAGIRIQGGRSIIQHQAIGTKLAQVAITLEVGRVTRSGRRRGHRTIPTLSPTAASTTCRSATMAQVFVSEAIYRANKDPAEHASALMGVMGATCRRRNCHPRRPHLLYSAAAGKMGQDALLAASPRRSSAYRRGPRDACVMQ